MKEILIRFDDICPTMDWNQWNRAMELLEKHHVKPLIGVIPDCKDPDLTIDPPKKDFWEYLKNLQSKGFAIAMHGYIHVYDTKVRGIVNETFHSEFAGHSYEEQYDKIKKGKEILLSHGIETDIFFAPAHSYDEITLKALSANGFKYVVDGKTSKPVERYGVVCIPCMSGGIPKMKEEGFYIAVFHAHEWIRPDKAEGYTDLKRLCEEYEDSIVDMDTFKSRPLGNPTIQVLGEKTYVFYERNIKPGLRVIKHLLVRHH